MLKKDLVLSPTKAIIFGLIIDIIISSVVSIEAYDVIGAFYEEPMLVSRGNVIRAVFPGIFIITAAILISYTLLSLKSKKKSEK